MAVSSYLSEAAGGMVVGAAFADDETASRAIDLLRASDVRWQDISVLARDAARADTLARDRAWTPSRDRGGLPLLRLVRRGGATPAVKQRYAVDLRGGRVVVLVAADGQPADTLAALFAQAGGERIEQWWQTPASLFAPPELGGPF